jgi:hypothetical protein
MGKLVHRGSRARATLLGSSALSTAALAMLLAGPQAALAACDVTSNPNSVSCAANTTTTNTTNTDGATASSNAFNQTFTANGAVSAGISAGVTVDGQGLLIQQQVVNGALTFHQRRHRGQPCRHQQPRSSFSHPRRPDHLFGQRQCHWRLWS